MMISIGLQIAREYFILVFKSLAQHPDMTKNKFRRYLKRVVTEDLSEKMVFIGGPRQACKTTFALGFLADGAKEEANPAYLNWNCAFCAT